MEYLGAWGTLVHEKNLKSKISCQTSFNKYSETEKSVENFFFTFLDFSLYKVKGFFIRWKTVYTIKKG